MIRVKLEAAVKTLESVIPSDCKSKNFTASKAQLEILQGIMTEALKKEKPVSLAWVTSSVLRKVCASFYAD